MKEVRGRILFLDDDADTCEVISALFDQSGYETITASTVREGLKLVEDESFDLVLLDWKLEDGTGIEVCQKIRTFDVDTPVFFCTGVGEDSKIREAVEAGAQGYFIKPVDFDSLLETISVQTGTPSCCGKQG